MFKELEGKKAYFIYTGHNRSYLKGKGVVEGEVLKVARTYITFTVGDSSLKHRLRMSDSNAVYGEYGESFLVFETQVEAEHYIKSETLARKIRGKMTDYSFKIENLGLNKLERIAELVGVK